MSEPVKVSLIGHSYLAEENRKSLTLLAQKVRLEVVSPRETEGMLFNFRGSDAPVTGEGWTMHFHRKWRPSFLPPAAFLLRSRDLGFQKFRPDIVHIEYDPFTPLFIQALLTARRIVPKAGIVCTVRQNTFTSRGVLADGVKTAVARLLVPRVDRFLAVNSGVAGIYKTRFRARPDQITPCTQIGVDTKLFSPGTPVGFPLERGDGLIGYCGRFVAYKGIPELVEAVTSLRNATGKDLRLVLLGKGPMREELLAAHRDASWLTIMDSVPHAAVAGFMAALDIFVMPSRILKEHVEHDAHALLEAMATGLPCIGAASGAICDVLEGAGVLVQPEAPEELARALRELVEDAGARRRYGTSGRQRVLENYSLEAVAATYVKVYGEVFTTHNPWQSPACHNQKERGKP